MCDNFSQCYHLPEGFWRASKRSKFSRAACAFDVVLNSRLQEILRQRIIQISDIASIFSQFCAHVRQKVFNGHEIRGFYSTLINCNTENFQRKFIDEFWFNRCFRKSSLRNYKKRSSLCFTWIHMFSCFSKSRKSTWFQRFEECLRVISKSNE